MALGLSLNLISILIWAWIIKSISGSLAKTEQHSKWLIEQTEFMGWEWVNDALNKHQKFKRAFKMLIIVGVVIECFLFGMIIGQLWLYFYGS